MLKGFKNAVDVDFTIEENRIKMEEAFKQVGVTIRWEGTGADEKGYDAETGKLLVDVNPEFYRPAEVEFLWGDCTKAEKELGWKRDIDFKALVAMMMDSDMKEIAGVGCEEFKNRK